MQAEVRYLLPRRRDGGTLENVAEERLDAPRAIAPRMIFYQTNLLTKPRAYEGGFSFNGGSGEGGHHAAACRTEWKWRKTNSPTCYVATSTT